MTTNKVSDDKRERLIAAGEICGVCGGRPSACRALGHRPESDRPEWHPELLARSAEPLGKPVAYAWRSKRDGSYGQIEERAEELRRDPWIKNGVAEIVPLYAAPFDCPSCGRPASKTIADACGQDPCALRSPERFNAASPELPAAASLSATKAPAITGADHGGDAQAHVTSAQYPGNAAPSNVAPRRCPTCDGPDPALHPAVQAGGEVQLCRDPWHKPTADEIEAKERAERSSEGARTPRTDAVRKLWLIRPFDGVKYAAMEEHARQLERELAQVLESHKRLMADADARYEALLAERSATGDAKDAGRYRWLREQDGKARMIVKAVKYHPNCGWIGTGFTELDEAIDAARLDSTNAKEKP